MGFLIGGLLLELLVGLGVGLRRLMLAPAQRRALWVLWVSANLRPGWVLWRAACGWVLHRAIERAVRACDQHEHAKAAATYPAQDGV